LSAFALNREVNMNDKPKQKLRVVTTITPISTKLRMQMDAAGIHPKPDALHDGASKEVAG